MMFIPMLSEHNLFGWGCSPSKTKLNGPRAPARLMTTVSSMYVPLGKFLLSKVANRVVVDRLACTKARLNA
eukprot:3896668-Amphidinium_carterae.1